MFDDDRRTEKYTVIIFTGGDQVFCSNTMSEVHYIQGLTHERANSSIQAYNNNTVYTSITNNEYNSFID